MAPLGVGAVDRLQQIAPGERAPPVGAVEQRQREPRRRALAFDDARRFRDDRTDLVHAVEVEHDAVARVVRALRRRRLRERVHDLGRGRNDELVLHVRGERAASPVVGDAPRLTAELFEEAFDGDRLRGDTLQVGERTRRARLRVVEADDGGDVLDVEASEEPGFVEAPVPVLGRRREQQHEQMAPREPDLDLPVPVRAGRDVDAGDETLDLPATEPLQRVAHRHCEFVILVFVADEDAELPVRWSFHETLP